MASVTGMTEDAIAALVADVVVDANLDTETGVLTLTKKDGSTSSAGVLANAQQAVELAYPVGSIYMGTAATNPGVLFGVGTWNRWGVGRVPVSLDATQTEFDTVEKTGGEKKHQLTVDELPAHTHTINHDHANATTSTNGTHDHALDRSSGTGGSNSFIPRGDGSGDGTSTASIANDGEHTHTVDIPTFTGASGSTGIDTAHNVLQPYITCFMWKRVA